MHRDAVGEIIFWAFVVFALAFYGFSAPAELPWESSAVALLAERHPIWAYFVEVFYGHYTVLSIVLAALSAGLVGAIVNCYIGWRFGVAVALVWVVWPGVWNGAVTGSPAIFTAFGAVAALWIVNGVALLTTERARWRLSMRFAGNASVALKGGYIFERGTLHVLIASYLALALAVLFAAVSICRHDYRLGEAAGAYARVTAAGPAQSVEEWAARWNSLAIYLGSRDAFVPTLRRAFAEEGLVLVENLRQANQPTEAWALCWRIYIEIDPGNDRALARMAEMCREGYNPAIEMPLGNLGVTETCVRKAIDRTGDDVWIFRLALALVLKARGCNTPELLNVLKIAVDNAPAESAVAIRRKFEPYFRVSERKLEHVIVTEPE